MCVLIEASESLKIHAFLKRESRSVDVMMIDDGQLHSSLNPQSHSCVYEFKKEFDT